MTCGLRSYRRDASSMVSNLISPFIPDKGVVRRAERIIAEYTGSRVEIVAAQPGNPRDAQVRRYGEAIALRAPPFGEGFFNRAYGFSDESLDDARDAIEWYAEKDVPAVFEVLPGLPSGALMALLAKHGYRQVGFHATFAGPSELPGKPSPGVGVRQVTTEADLAQFADVYHAGWANTGRIPVQPWLTAPGWSLFLGLCDEEPAGAAVLYVWNGTGYLADSAVDPKWRRRGVHRTLLDARCADAAARGCTEIYSSADYLSASCRNMLRKGLSLLMTKSLLRAGVQSGQAS
jgi:GNAT superfamily N-acetyltransferase